MFQICTTHSYPFRKSLLSISWFQALCRVWIQSYRGCSEPHSTQSSGLGLWEDSGEGMFVLAFGIPSLKGILGTHTQDQLARFPLCLQSSGNVWVTHEEMETLATPTKTVSLALGPGLGLMIPTRMKGKVWEVRGGCSRSIVRLVSLMYVGFCSQGGGLGRKR